MQARTGLLRLVGVGAALLGVTSCGRASFGKQAPLTLEQIVNADPLPMVKGSRWTYYVTIKRYDPQADKEVIRSLTWTTEVMAATRKRGLVAYTIKGWPSDLADFEGTPKPTVRTLLRSQNQFLWAASGAGSAEGAAGWFTWPMFDPQRICPSADTVYCWTVAAVDTRYQLSHYTGPDEESYELALGTGVTNYHYQHHGTMNDVEAKLVSYSPGHE